MASISPSPMKTSTGEKSNEQTLKETSTLVTSMESNSTQSPTSVAVTPQRKQELLLEARRARVEWVDSSSIPFRFNTSFEEIGHNDHSPSRLQPDSNGINTHESDERNFIQTTYAGISIPSAVEVVNLLYGVGEEEGGGLTQKSLNARVFKQLSSQVSAENTKKVICNHEGEKSSIFTMTNTSNSFYGIEAIEKNKSILQAIQNYSDFIQKLRSPESAEIVQTTRHFVTSIPDIVTRNTVHTSKSTVNDNPNTSKNDSNEKSDNNDVIATAKHVAQSIHSYIDNRIESIQKINNSSKITNNVSSDSNEPQPTNLQEQIKDHIILQKLGTSIQTYLKSTCDSMRKSSKTSPLSSVWVPSKTDTEKGKNGEPSEEDKLWEAIQTAFESFLYSKCHETIWKVLDPDPALSIMKDSVDLVKDVEEPNKRILETMEKLHFLNAKHLEIQCILKCDAYKSSLTTQGSESELVEENKTEINSSPNEFNLQTEFKIPIQLLQTLSAWYSPADKLRCIYQTYKEIVIVLSNLSNSTQSSSSENQPSADDILPAFIYTLIQAKPFPIVSNLKFIESMAREDQLRGEEGYAFTNLYGAVQFLLDLNLDLGENSMSNENDEEDISHDNDDNGKVDDKNIPFAIEAGEWKAHLRQYQEKKLSQMMEKMDGKSKGQDDDSINIEKHDTTESISGGKDFPSILEIRAARLRGEEIDLKWISQWQAQKNHLALPKPENLKESKEHASPSVQEQDRDNRKNNNAKPASPSTFPLGFTRSYSFLGKKPHDIRMGDIPQLLSEYHQLVHACETMVSERNAIQKESQKLKIERQRNKLQNIVIAADASTSND